MCIVTCALTSSGVSMAMKDKLFRSKAGTVTPAAANNLRLVSLASSATEKLSTDVAGRGLVH